MMYQSERVYFPRYDSRKIGPVTECNEMGSGVPWCCEYVSSLTGIRHVKPKTTFPTPTTSATRDEVSDELPARE